MERERSSDVTSEIAWVIGIYKFLYLFPTSPYLSRDLLQRSESVTRIRRSQLNREAGLIWTRIKIFFLATPCTSCCVPQFWRVRVGPRTFRVSWNCHAVNQTTYSKFLQESVRFFDTNHMRNWELIHHLWNASTTTLGSHFRRTQEKLRTASTWPFSSKQSRARKEVYNHKALHKEHHTYQFRILNSYNFPKVIYLPSPPSSTMNIKYIFPNHPNPFPFRGPNHPKCQTWASKMGTHIRI